VNVNRRRRRRRRRRHLVGARPAVRCDCDTWHTWHPLTPPGFWFWSFACSCCMLLVAWLFAFLLLAIEAIVGCWLLATCNLQLLGFWLLAFGLLAFGLLWPLACDGMPALPGPWPLAVVSCSYSPRPRPRSPVALCVMVQHRAPLHRCDVGRGLRRLAARCYHAPRCALRSFGLGLGLLLYACA
jgi:hypothetical protein